MKKYENFFKQTLIPGLLLISSAIPLSATTASYSPAQLTLAAENWMEQQFSDSASDIRFEVVPLDNRIGNKNCDSELEISLPQGSSQRQNTLLIRCPDIQNWQLYLSVRISEIVQAVVSKQNIATGNILTAEMLQTESRQRRFIRGNIVQDPAQIIGARSKRALNIGQIITLQDLCLVCKGDIVTITVDNSGLAVSATGVAQADGTLGDTIKILNRQSQRTIEAEVSGVNIVKVKF